MSGGNSPQSLDLHLTTPHNLNMNKKFNSERLVVMLPNLDHQMGVKRNRDD